MKYRLILPSYIKFKNIFTKHFSTKIPLTPVETLVKKNYTRTVIDKNTLALLERLSLVNYNTPEGIKVLEDSIAFADNILHLDTTNIQPLYSVLEDENLGLRKDKITQGNCQKDILRNAYVTEDDYFVAPLGNIPLHEVAITEEESSKQQDNEN